MPANVEIKVRVRDMPALRERVARIAEQGPRTTEQEDVFFNTAQGRLKLRLVPQQTAELIYYERPDTRGPKASQYHIARTEAPAPLRALLAAALGERGVVRKRREFYMLGRTRIHLDEVDGLGAFLELEVMLQPGERPGQGQSVAVDLMERLAVSEDDLMDVAYIDLLERGDA